jgi:hypothetical protein
MWGRGRMHPLSTWCMKLRNSSLSCFSRCTKRFGGITPDFFFEHCIWRANGCQCRRVVGWWPAIRGEDLLEQVRQAVEQVALVVVRQL